MGTRAFVDESAAGRAYVLGVVTVDADAVNTCRERLMLAAGGRGRRIHLSATPDKHRAGLVDQVVEGPWLSRAFGAYGAFERSRRLLIAAMPWLMADFETLESVVFESRGIRLDASDLALIERLRGQGVRFPWVYWHRPRDEPLLWAADVVAGTASRAMAGGGASPFPCIVLDG